MPDDKTLYDDDGRAHERNWRGEYEPRWSVADQDYVRDKRARERDPAGHSTTDEALYRKQEQSKSSSAWGSGMGGGPPSGGGSGGIVGGIIGYIIVFAAIAIFRFTFSHNKKGVQAIQEGKWVKGVLHHFALAIVMLTILAVGFAILALLGG